MAGENNIRVPFPAPRLQKTLQDKEREEDEQEARAEQLDETIVSRDEWKRRALRVMKQRDRENAEREAIEKGAQPPRTPPALAKAVRGFCRFQAKTEQHQGF